MDQCVVIMPACIKVTTALRWISRLPRQHAVTSVYVSVALEGGEKLILSQEVLSAERGGGCKHRLVSVDS